MKVRIDAKTARKNASASSILYKNVAIHPLGDKMTKYFNLRVPACVELPRNEFFILEGMFFEAGTANQVGKKIQLVYNLNSSSIITDQYLDEYELSAYQEPIATILAR